MHIVPVELHEVDVCVLDGWLEIMAKKKNKFFWTIQTARTGNSSDTDSVPGTTESFNRENSDDVRGTSFDFHTDVDPGSTDSEK